jgi:acetyltransferase
VFDIAEVLAAGRRPRGPRLAVVTDAGGPGVMAADTLLEQAGELAELSDETVRSLDSELPPYWSRGNPVDVLGDAGPERFATAVEALGADDGVDALLAITTPQAMTDPTGVADAVVAASSKSRKPLLAAWMGGAAVRTGRHHLRAAGVPTYRTPEQAVRAFMHLVEHARTRDMLYEHPGRSP